MAEKKIVCVDFDGVLHSYSSGWKGACVIPDPPVPGALDWLHTMLVDGRFDVCIYSSRSKEPGAIEAMKAWFIKHFREKAENYGTGSGLPWAEAVVSCLSFPTQKPAAHLSIDDRGYCFEGTFPRPDWIDGFRPWNKRGLRFCQTCDANVPTDSFGNCLMTAVCGGTYPYRPGKMELSRDRS